MKALLLKEYMHVEMADMPKPDIGPSEVLVRVMACGICGSDVHGFDGSTGRRIPPLIMGHEAAGLVVGMGAMVRGLHEGTRVTFDSTVWCGTCFFCRRGQINLCENRQVLGVSCKDYRRHGAFAEYVAVPQHIVYPLPDSLSYEQAALVEAVSVAVHAVGLTPISLGDTAVVVGTGMIGLLIVQALRLAGCGRIIAVDLDDAKLELARQLGADDVLNPKNCHISAEVQERTDGRGSDVAMEAVGATAPIQTAIASLRKGGVLTLVGNISPLAEIPLQDIVTRQIKLLGSCASAGEYPRCLDLVARGAIRVEALISVKAPLSEGAQWLHRLYNQEPNLMKVVLQP
jgi:L-iditol 2-dehydrogenase